MSDPDYLLLGCGTRSAVKREGKGEKASVSIRFLFRAKDKAQGLEHSP